MVKKVKIHTTNKDFLLRLESFGIEQGYFEKKEIRNIDKTSCTSSKTEVIDFDKTKEKISQEKNFQETKSSDALKILPEHNRIDFIEFKSLKKFIANNIYDKKKNIISEKRFDNSMKKHIHNFNFSSKISDSLFILQTIINARNFKLKKEEKVFFEQTEKNFIILVDINLNINPIQAIAASLDLLAQTSTRFEILIAKEFQTLITKENSSSLHNLKSPILKSCEDIDYFYNSIT